MSAEARSAQPPHTAATHPQPAASADREEAPASFELALADDALVLSHRLAEWSGHAPVLEEELALANIALDLLGQARTLYSQLGDEDELAYLRPERAFRNCQLAEQPNGDFAHTVIRQLYFSGYQRLLYTQLAQQGHPLAAKAVHEVTYHQDHAEQWALRLGDGTPESHARTQRAVDALWPYTGELFRCPQETGTGAGTAAAEWTARWGVNWPQLEESWLSGTAEVLHRAGLTVPEGSRHGGWSAGAGREGLHSETFGRMLAEMQHLHRSHPGASW